LFWGKGKMTEHERIEFQEKLEKQNFIFNDELLKELVERKIKQLHYQSKEDLKLRSVLKMVK
jgi:hypothetical protein